MSFVRYFYYEAKKPGGTVTRDDLREQLAKDVQAFLDKGGKIEQIEQHASGALTEEGDLIIRWNNKLSKLQEVQADGSIRSVKKQREALKEKTMNSVFKNKT